MAKKNRDVLYVLTGENKPETLILQAKDTARKRLVHMDNEKGARALRYASNHLSPYVEEQMGEVFDREPIVFEQGYIHVPFANKALQNFLDIHPLNGSLFEKHDPEKIAQEEEAQMDMEFEAMSLAKNSDIEVLGSAIRILMDRNVDEMSTSEIKRDAKWYAREYPESFIAALKDPSIDRKNTVRRSFSEQLVSARNKDTEVYYNFPDKKSRIMVVPVGEDMYEAFEHYLTNTKEGVELYKILKNTLDKE